MDFVEECRLNHFQPPGFEPFLETQTVAVNMAREIPIQGLCLKLAEPRLAVFVPVNFVEVSVGHRSRESVGYWWATRLDVRCW